VTPAIVAAAVEELGENIADQQTIDSNGVGPNGVHAGTMGQVSALTANRNRTRFSLDPRCLGLSHFFVLWRYPTDYCPGRCQCNERHRGVVIAGDARQHDR